MRPWGFDSLSFRSLASLGGTSLSAGGAGLREAAPASQETERAPFRTHRARYAAPSPSAGSSIRQSASLTKRRLGVRFPRRGLVATSFKRQDARLLPGECWFEPSRRSSRLGRLAGSGRRSLKPVTRVRIPLGALVDDGRARERAGLIRRYCLVRLQGRRSRLVVGERGHPAGFGRRRSQVRLLPARFSSRLRRRIDADIPGTYRVRGPSSARRVMAPRWRCRAGGDSAVARPRRARCRQRGERRRSRALPGGSRRGQGAARGRGVAVLASLMSSRPWVRIPPAQFEIGRRRAVKGVTEQGLVQSAGPNVQLASLSLQGQPVRRWRCGHALAGAPMGNQLAPEPLGRQRLCLRLRGADPAFHLSLWGDVAQTSRALVCQARGRRFEPGRPRSRGDRGVAAASEVVSLEASVRIRSVTSCGR